VHFLSLLVLLGLSGGITSANKLLRHGFVIDRCPDDLSYLVPIRFSDADNWEKFQTQKYLLKEMGRFFGDSAQTGKYFLENWKKGRIY
jgi:hypothetical protein